MIKVHVKSCIRKDRFNNIDLKKLRAMKSWCRDTLGKNEKGKPRIWFTGRDWYYPYDEGGFVPFGYVYPVFYFGEEEHATLFSLVWL